MGSIPSGSTNKGLSMKCTVYARPPGFFAWLIVGWYIVRIFPSSADAITFLDEADLGGYYLAAIEMPLPLPVKFRLWPKFCRPMKVRYA